MAEMIAEGMETQEQTSLLATARCNYMQGYLYSGPMPAEEFEELLKQGNLQSLREQRFTIANCRFKAICKLAMPLHE